jgi:hypothetical protein
MVRGLTVLSSGIEGASADCTPARSILGILDTKFKRPMNFRKLRLRTSLRKHYPDFPCRCPPLAASIRDRGMNYLFADCVRSKGAHARFKSVHCASHHSFAKNKEA